MLDTFAGLFYAILSLVKSNFNTRFLSLLDLGRAHVSLELWVVTLKAESDKWGKFSAIIVIAPDIKYGRRK